MNATQCRFENIPTRMRGRPIDHRGFPVPWFVTEKTENGLWDFVRIRGERVAEAVRQNRCWVTGEKLGRHAAFVIGPMCVINRVAADPPVIPEIAEWSAQVCPFLSRPMAKRPNQDEGQGATPGVMVMGNPGICAVWVTQNHSFNRHRLFDIGTPISISWWREGRHATTDEISIGFEAGVERLRKMAEQEGNTAVAYFENLLRVARLTINAWSPTP